MIKIFENWKLKYKILFVALLPILAVCIAVIIINNTVIKMHCYQKQKMNYRLQQKHYIQHIIRIQENISEMIPVKSGKVHTMYHSLKNL